MRRKGLMLGGCLAVAWIATLSICGLASAAETHVFNATRSLMGSCLTTTLDPVPDPGCPGGTHPAEGFSRPRGSSADEFGNLFVATAGKEDGHTPAIDIFDATGHFKGEIQTEGEPTDLSVDSNGLLYVYEEGGELTSFSRVVVYKPASVGYDPEHGELAYEDEPVVIPSIGEHILLRNSIAIDPADDHVFVDVGGSQILEFGTFAEGNPLLTSGIGSGELQNSVWVAIDGQTGDVYASSSETAFSPAVIKVFDGETSGYPLKLTIDGTKGPSECSGAFGSVFGLLSVAVSEVDGHVFVDDRNTGKAKKPVREFTEDGTCVGSVERKFEYVFASGISVDNGVNSPNRGYLYVPSGEETGRGHLYAYEPKGAAKAPIVTNLSASDVTSTEASLSADINPESSPTTYAIDIVSKANFEESGFAGAQRVGAGNLAAASEASRVSASATGLSAGVRYVYRVTAENECEPGGCTDEASGEFTTFGEVPAGEECPNQASRFGASAALPDCRAYELVTPPDTGGHSPSAIGIGAGESFGTPTVEANGEAVGFLSTGGALPGLEGAGGFSGDGYLSRRNQSGWETVSAGPTGAESTNPLPGGLSPDLAVSTWTAYEGGSLAVNGARTVYVRSSNGEFTLVGEGSLGRDLAPQVEYISPDGSHVVIVSAMRLEPPASATNELTVYDRTSSGLHVVSLLPSGEAPPGQAKSSFQGASADGSVIAFTVSQPTAPTALYLRVHGERTDLVSSEIDSFAGLSANGRYVYYLKGGDLFVFDDSNGTTKRATTAGNVVVANVASEGPAAYIISTSVLTKSKNPIGSKAISGEQNLYQWTEAGLKFVATVTQRDVEGEFTGPSGFQMDGLGLWAGAIPRRELAVDPSRATPSGTVLVFSSRADVTGYDSNNHPELYRYDTDSDTLACISCDPTGAPATGGASLQEIATKIFQPQPTSRFSLIPNVSANGERVIFETASALTPTDSNGQTDVYEWEGNGVGSCHLASGCVFLLSSGSSARATYLYGVDASGSNVFLVTTDQLVSADADETPSIYDARIDGGFTSSHSAACQGEACKPQPTPPPPLAAAASPALGASGNLEQPKKCSTRATHKAKSSAAKKKTSCKTKHHKKSKAKHKKQKAGMKGGQK